MPEGPIFPECFDPYLRYAISTGFKNFEFFDERNFALLLLAELKQSKDAAKFEEEMGGLGVEFGPDVGDTRFITMRGKRAAVEPDSWCIWKKYVSRVELSLPSKPSTTAFSRKRRIIPRFEQGKDPPGSLLIGVLDDGCPFAAAHLLKTLASGAVGTRVRAIWDQNHDKEPVTMPDGRDFGQKLVDFDYGLEYRRDFASSVTSKQIGLDEWIGMHSTPTRSIDEGGCYADAGFTSLSRRQSHGAHVMDVFAGRIPISSRVGPSSPGDPRDPPTWMAATDPASSVDVIFVQFSRDCIRDASGVWLKNYVVQGIQYILSYNAVLCFAEVWVDSADAGAISVTLISPSGESFTSTSPPSAASVVGPVVWGTQTVWLLAIGPTILTDGTVVEHGNWTINVADIGEGVEVHAYVARSDPNMGVRTGAKRSYFVDHTWEQTRSAEASNTRTDGEFDTTGSLICRDGTLNGIATAEDCGVHVAGGYVIANRRKSIYSSAGPARNGPLMARPGPDFALPCDGSYALGGIRAGGNRSGAVFRLTGTSAAAPQLARRIANPPIPPVRNTATTPREIARRGRGNLDPP